MSDVQRALLRQIDTVAAHLELRAAAARVCAEHGDRPGFTRWAALEQAAERRLAHAIDRLARYRAHEAEYGALLTDAERSALLRRIFDDHHRIGDHP